MKARFRATLTTLFLCLGAAAHAQTSQVPVTINTLGSHDGETFFFTLKEGLSVNCLYGVIYCPASNPDCKSRLAVALTAKAMNRPVEVRYDQDPSSSMCNLWMITIQ